MSSILSLPLQKTGFIISGFLSVLGAGTILQVDPTGNLLLFGLIALSWPVFGFAGSFVKAAMECLRNDSECTLKHWLLTLGIGIVLGTLAPLAGDYVIAIVIGIPPETIPVLPGIVIAALGGFAGQHYVEKWSRDRGIID